MTTLEEQEIIDMVRKYTQEIRKFSSGMKYKKDVDILKRTMPMIISLFKSNADRKQESFSYFGREDLK